MPKRVPFESVNLMLPFSALLLSISPWLIMQYQKRRSYPYDGLVKELSGTEDQEFAVSQIDPRVSAAGLSLARPARSLNFWTENKCFLFSCMLNRPFQRTRKQLDHQKRKRKRSNFKNWKTSFPQFSLHSFSRNVFLERRGITTLCV